MTQAKQGQQSYLYKDLVRRLYDFESLTVPPQAGEKSGCFSSFDRSSVYNAETGLYENWGANNDGGGFIRKEGDSIVAMELDGPGVIWRFWSALPEDGNIRIYIDHADTPVINQPFRDYFEKFNREGPPANFPNLSPTLSRGRNSFIPIPFQKHCKVLLDKGWGAYYHITYTSFPSEVKLPSFDGRIDKESAIALAEADRVLQQRGIDSFLNTEGSSLENVTVSVPAGGKAVLFDKQGAGAISMIRIRTDLGRKSEEQQRILVRQLAILMKWDNEVDPSVWAPLGDFFGSAPGIKPYRSLPLGMNEHEMYSYWYMPFSEGARIEIENDGTQPCEISADIRYFPLRASHTNDLLRFHAKWHRDDYLDLDMERFKEGGDRWPDWPLLLTKGRGRFCGVHLHVYNTWEKPDEEAETWWYGRWDRKTIDWWWGEGDEKFFVDGESFPSTFGTGSEDYIGYAWAAEPPFPMFDSAFASQPFIELDANGHTSVSRFHICDNIPFMNSFEGFIEKYKENQWGPNNQCLYASTVYWYQERCTSDDYRPVSVNDRLVTLNTRRDKR
ncbi:glycoside hydrolase family 172 protein [Paenibacillus xylanexedens]|uniref:glycoside hydrolase family 172 protein n=1 Tax=Paenibacillus xylanexedens TaxID=528191 RepID=UPI0011A52A90|nr:glycoside hydrolase family 172 protein [Paenibacillus xylanexedens]